MSPARRKAAVKTAAAEAAPNRAAANRKRESALRRNPKRDRTLQDLDGKFSYAQPRRKLRRT
jgi:hypothetical protein